MATNMVPQDMLPPQVQQVAASHRLGAFLKAYNASLVRTIIGALVFLVGAILFFAGGIFPLDETVMTRGILLVFALLFLGMAIYMVSTVIQAAGRQIYLFQEGIVIDKSNQVQAFPWNQVAEVWQSITRNYRNGVYVGTTYMYTLRRVDGYQVKLNNLMKDIAELGPAIAEGITRELVPRALHSIRTGQTLTFAPFSVNQQGISNGREFLPWSQVQAVEVKQGRVTVKKTGTSRGSWMTMVAKIPNFLVFTVVAEEIRRQAERIQ
ncbi:MAG: DUF6585 family protein [Ktedonobacteraceae bacterium]